MSCDNLKSRICLHNNARFLHFACFCTQSLLPCQSTNQLLLKLQLYGNHSVLYCTVWCDRSALSAMCLIISVKFCQGVKKHRESGLDRLIGVFLGWVNMHIPHMICNLPGFEMYAMLSPSDAVDLSSCCNATALARAAFSTARSRPLSLHLRG